MSSPYYPPQPPKRLLRSTSNRVIGGVCGGLADYLNMDANLVRILTVLISLFTGVPVILYIIALFVIPEGNTVPSAPPPVTGTSNYSGPFSGTQASTPPPAYAPYPDTAAAGMSRPNAEDAVWGSEAPPWEQRQPEASVPPHATMPEATPPPPAEPKPTAPSEPEAPVVPPKDDGPKPT
jgi:phage shock protein PspC (stress-responsive transcriptional regulator)